MSYIETVKKKSHDDKLKMVQSKIEELEVSLESASADGSVTLDGVNKADWTQSYDYWDKWKDTDDLADKLKETRTQEREIQEKDRPSFLNHRHDHSEEKRIFESPESQ